jgi:1,4-alpha-glucan branching enzyme
MWFFDRVPTGDNNNSLYFTDQGWAGGLVFAYWNNDVKAVPDRQCAFPL